MFTDSSMACRRQRLSQGCWQTRPVEDGSGLSMTTERNASSRRCSWKSCRKRGSVVFEFVPEMAHSGEHGIGRALAQAAERSIADHAAHLVQPVQVAGAGVALGEGVQDAQRLIQTHAAGDAFAAG